MEGIDIFPIFAATIINNYSMSIDTYKLTSMEEPTDEVLSQLMREAAQDAQKANETPHRPVLIVIAGPRQVW